MREPSGIFPPSPSQPPEEIDIPNALASGQFDVAVARLYEMGRWVMQCDRNVPLPQMIRWLDAIPEPYSRASEVRSLRAWLFYEQRMPLRALLLMEELAAEWQAKLDGPEGDVAAGWLMVICGFEGTLYLSEGRLKEARQAFAQCRAHLRRLVPAGGVQPLHVPPEEARRLVETDPTGMCAVAIDALAMYQAARDRAGTARMAHHLGQHYLDRGEPVPARYWLERALELRRGSPGELPLAYTLDSLGECYPQLGLLTDAQHALDEALRIATAAGAVMVQAAALSHLAAVCCDREEYPAALDLCRMAAALSEQLRDGPGLARTQLVLSTIYRRQGQFGLAADAAKEARTSLQGFGDPAALASAELTAWVAALLSGDEAAPARVEALLAELGEAGSPRERILGHWYLALAAHRRGDEAERQRHLHLALSLGLKFHHLHLLAMELPLTAALCGPIADQGLYPEALAGLVQRATARGLAALLEAAPAAREVVAGAGRLAEATALSVQMLGTFRVTRAGRDIDLGAGHSQKAVSLFKYLVAHRGRPVVREQILEAIWPEAAPEAAARSLEVILSTLRRMLDAPNGPPAITRRGRGYLINPALALEVDVDKFIAHCDRGSWWWQRGQSAPAVAEWQAAEKCYSGDYLAEDPYEDWATAEREGLRERCLDLLTRLGELAYADGRYGEAVERAHRVLAADPIRETAFRLLMLAHARQGNRAVAMRDFRRYVEALHHELGVAPAPETQELADRIHAGESI